MPEIDTSTKPWLWWDICKLVEDYVKAELEDQEEHPEIYDEIRTEEQIRKACYEDHDFDRTAWDDLYEVLTDWMTETHPDGLWSAAVNGFGWQNLSGVLPPFRAEDGETLLQKILPKTDCTFNIWKHETEPRLKIQNFHHDSSSGREVYTVRGVHESDEEDL